MKIKRKGLKKKTIRHFNTFVCLIGSEMVQEATRLEWTQQSEGNLPPLTSTA